MTNGSMHVSEWRENAVMKGTTSPLVLQSPTTGKRTLLWNKIVSALDCFEDNGTALLDDGTMVYLRSQSLVFEFADTAFVTNDTIPIFDAARQRLLAIHGIGSVAHWLTMENISLRISGSNCEMIVMPRVMGASESKSIVTCQD